MALSIKKDGLDRKVRELARLTRRGLTDAIELAVDNELARHPMVGPEEQARRLRAIAEVQARVAALPVLDPRSPDEILGYDERGLPT